MRPLSQAPSGSSKFWKKWSTPNFLQNSHSEFLFTICLNCKPTGFSVYMVNNLGCTQTYFGIGIRYKHSLMPCLKLSRTIAVNNFILSDSLARKILRYSSPIQCSNVSILSNIWNSRISSQVREELSWTPGSQRSLVMLGDASPHPPSYHLNKLKIDWREEAKKLYNEMGVRIYSVQCLNYGGSDTFYRQLAELTCGWHLKLDQFASIVDFLTAICYREQGVEHLEAFEAEVKARSKGSGLNRNMHSLFDTLAGRSTSSYKGGTDYGGLVPVNPSRFQVSDVAVWWRQRHSCSTFHWNRQNFVEKY